MTESLALPHDTLARMEMLRQLTESQTPAYGNSGQYSRKLNSESIIRYESRNGREQRHTADEAATAALRAAELVLVKLRNARECDA